MDSIKEILTHLKQSNKDNRWEEAQIKLEREVRATIVAELYDSLLEAENCPSIFDYVEKRIRQVNKEQKELERAIRKDKERGEQNKSNT